MGRPKLQDWQRGSTYLKKSKSGTLTWYLRVYDDGQPVTRASAATTKQQAESELRDAQNRIKDGLPPFPETNEHAGKLFVDVVEEWRGWLLVDQPGKPYKGRYRSAKRTAWCAKKYLLSAFPHLRIEDLDRIKITKWLGRLESETDLSSNTRLHIFQTLSRCLTWAVDQGYCQHNSCKDVSRTARPKRSNKSKWLQTPEQFQRLKSAIKDMPRPFDTMIRLGCTTGMRPGEIVSLRLGDLKWMETRSAIRVRFNNGDGFLKEDHEEKGLTKWVPCTPELREELRDQINLRRLQGAEDKDYLFAKENGSYWARESLTRHWAQVRDAHGLGDFSLYEVTRHTVASQLIENGASIEEVSRVLNHADTRITRSHYIHTENKTYTDSLTCLLPKI